MDFGFAPGDGQNGDNLQDDTLRLVFDGGRPNTSVISTKKVLTLRDFIEHLRTSSSVPPPIGDILLGSHANNEGKLFLPMFRGQSGSTSFETLEQTLLQASRSIRIPDSLIGHTTGDPITHAVHLKGCSIGVAAPFLAKLKEALGGHVKVTAPTHFHGLTPIPGLGVFEWLAQEFVLIRKDPIADRPALIAAFQARNFPRFDGPTVPAGEWDKWIPKRRRDRIPTKPKEKWTNATVSYPLGVTVGKRTTVNAVHRIELGIQFEWIVAYNSASDVPSSTADRRQAMEDAISAAPVFQAGHPYPGFVRRGYANLADFFTGYESTFSNSKMKIQGSLKHVLKCLGTRHEYTVAAPITDPATGNLIFNFYPTASSSPAAITSGLQESNARFFKTA